MRSAGHFVAVTALVALCAAVRAQAAPDTLNAPDGRARPRPSVSSAAGEVQGRWVEAERGGAGFAAYLGIPYARPPVGHLRFKSPKPLKPGDGQGPLDAGSDPPPCPQIDIHSAGKEVIGQEDCLYLNVYVPQRTDPAAAPLPVLFVVHGGAFEHGSGRMDAFGPHFLLAGDVLVVAANFRQGALGFLSLDTEGIPGNAGLKDLAMALRWVKNNVAAFGGDPTRVTALGWSTGASAVHILSLLPATRGLLSRAVLLSGHAISPRAYTERHVDRATALASILGAPDNGTDAVTRTLRDASVEALLRACDDRRMRSVGLPLPSPERRVTKGAETKLLLQDPESLLRLPRAPPLPILLGVDGREGSFPFQIWGLNARSPQALDELLPQLMPADLLPGADTAAILGLGAPGASPGALGPSGAGAGAGPGPGPLAKDATIRLAQLVRDEYSGGGPIASNSDAFIEFLGDAFLYASLWRAVGFVANSSTEAAPLHLYRFQVDDAYNFAKKLYGISVAGASHVDDLGYLGRFDHQPDLHQDMTGTGVAAKTLLRMTGTVTNFAKGVAPTWPAVPAGGQKGTPEAAPASSSASWPALHLGPGSRMRLEHAEIPHHAFWTSAYRDLRSRASSIGRG